MRLWLLGGRLRRVPDQPTDTGTGRDPVPPAQQPPVSTSISAPHCDPTILHRPGACTYCDVYPSRQADRVTQQINFTGEHDPEKAPCPSEHFRTAEARDRWPGNTPEGYWT